MSKRRSLKRRQKPPFERAKDYCRKFTTFLFSNVGIILLVIVYMIGGAFMFRAIEVGSKKPHPLKDILAKERHETALTLWKVTIEANAFFDIKLFKSRAEKEIREYQKNIIKAQSSEADAAELWSFPGALLYSLTVITTIGYGNISPRTNMGKVCTIIYAIFGMPLFLLYLSNIGDILAKSFKWIYAKLCLCRLCPEVAKRRAIRERRRTMASALEEDIDYFLQMGMSPADVQLEAIDQDEEDEDAETVTVPVTVCVFIMIGYILFGAILFGEWEKWGLLDGSYFCFISLSSIGFGDIVPGDKLITSKGNDVQLSFILCAVYLLLGMALIAMCFNLMQEQVLHTMRSVKRVISLCFRCDR